MENSLRVVLWEHKCQLCKRPWSTSRNTWKQWGRSTNMSHLFDLYCGLPCRTGSDKNNAQKKYMQPLAKCHSTGLLTCKCDPASVRSRNSEKVVAPQSQQPHNLGLACWELNGTDLVWGDWSCVVFNSGWWEFKWWKTEASMVKMNENDAIVGF